MDLRLRGGTVIINRLVSPLQTWAPSGCRSIASGLTTAIEVAMGAARENQGNDDNGYHRHLHLHGQRLLRRHQDSRPQRQGQAGPRREPLREGSALPHLRLGNVELGAAWQKTAKDTERDYLSVKLDDPSFPAPIYATLIEVEGEEGLSSSGPGRTGTEAPRQRPRRKAGPFCVPAKRLNRTLKRVGVFCAALLLSLRPHGARLPLGRYR